MEEATQKDRLGLFIYHMNKYYVNSKKKKQFIFSLGADLMVCVSLDKFNSVVYI